MKNIEYKLQEAIFFFNKMKEMKEIFPDFDYYLNAFFSSSRAILWIMNSEYSKVNGWKEWYDNKDVNDSLNVMLNGIAKARNRATKQEPLHLDEFITICGNDDYIDLMEKMQRFGGKEVEIEIKRYNDRESDDLSVIEENSRLSVSGILSINNTIREFKHRDIFEVCAEYIDWLTEIVNECIEKFG